MHLLQVRCSTHSFRGFIFPSLQKNFNSYPLFGKALLNHLVSRTLVFPPAFERARDVSNRSARVRRGYRPCLSRAIVLKFIAPTAQAYLFVPRWLRYSASALKVDRDTAGEVRLFIAADTDETLSAILLERRRYFHRRHGNRTLPRLHRDGFHTRFVACYHIYNARRDASHVCTYVGRAKGLLMRDEWNMKAHARFGISSAMVNRFRRHVQ